MTRARPSQPPHPTLTRWDVVVVGGGPAGLSAALVLGRATRRVLVCDDQRYRNDRALQVNGYLTRDGVPPAELRQLGRAELARYPVEIVHQHVMRAVATNAGFHLTLADGCELWARAVVLATGVTDVLPAIPGVQELLGRSIFHCPYCDGWEQRGQPIGIHGREGADFALTLYTWSRDIMLFADGPVDRSTRERLAGAGIPVVEEPVAAFLAHQDRLQWVALASGRLVKRTAIFLKLDGGQRQRSNLAQQLGVPVELDGGIQHDGHGTTRTPGVFVAGDTTRDLRLAIIAAAEGAEVAVSANHYLQERDR